MSNCIKKLIKVKLIKSIVGCVNHASIPQSTWCNVIHRIVLIGQCELSYELGLARKG